MRLSRGSEEFVKHQVKSPGLTLPSLGLGQKGQRVRPRHSPPSPKLSSEISDRLPVHMPWPQPIGQRGHRKPHLLRVRYGGSGIVTSSSFQQLNVRERQLILDVMSLNQCCAPQLSVLKFL